MRKPGSEIGEETLMPNGPAGVEFLCGSGELLCTPAPARRPFDPELTGLLSRVGELLSRDPGAKEHPAALAFAFWVREASLTEQKRRFSRVDGLRVGRGTVFHIAPGNVPANFAYSLAAGLLSGNRNIVRAPSRDFPEARLIVRAFNAALSERPELAPYVVVVRYPRESAATAEFSALADARVIWGGDETVRRVRENPLPARSFDITFADRYSLAVIDADAYLARSDKARTARDFYNDTFAIDQNACGSPRLVAWLGGERERAKEIFWGELLALARRLYDMPPVCAVDKLTLALEAAAALPGCRLLPGEDNLVTRVAVERPDPRLMDFRGNSGYFYEYDCADIAELREFCADKRCQTLTYIGDRERLVPLALAGGGVDRIVPVGHAMDFSLLWDGYDLVTALSRGVEVR